MTLAERLRSDLTAAMKARDELTVSVLRGIFAGMTNELVATRRKPTESLSEDEIISVIRRGVKQRKDSIEQFRAGGREDLAAKEERECAILARYLPARMSREEIERVVRAKLASLGPAGKDAAGKFMGAVMQELKGRAEGAEVRVVVERVLAGD